MNTNFSQIDILLTLAKYVLIPVDNLKRYFMGLWIKLYYFVYKGVDTFT